jgi:hypothetical protein
LEGFGDQKQVSGGVNDSDEQQFTAASSVLLQESFEASFRRLGSPLQGGYVVQGRR